VAAAIVCCCGSQALPEGILPHISSGPMLIDLAWAPAVFHIDSGNCGHEEAVDDSQDDGCKTSQMTHEIFFKKIRGFALTI